MRRMLMPLKRYAQFNRRSGRSEYWWFQLFLLFVAVALTGLALVAGYTGSRMLGLVSRALGLLAWLTLLLPLTALTVRRLHDSGRSGWWCLLSLVPFGGLVVIAFLLMPGMPGGNRFGAPVPHV